MRLAARAAFAAKIVAGLIFTMVLWALQVTPEDTASHAAAWLKRFGWSDLPPWLTQQEADHYLSLGVTLLLFATVFWILWPAIVWVQERGFGAPEQIQAAKHVYRPRERLVSVDEAARVAHDKTGSFNPILTDSAFNKAYYLEVIGYLATFNKIAIYNQTDSASRAELVPAETVARLRAGSADGNLTFRYGDSLIRGSNYVRKGDVQTIVNWLRQSIAEHRAAQIHSDGVIKSSSWTGRGH